MDNRYDYRNLKKSLKNEIANNRYGIGIRISKINEYFASYPEDFYPEKKQEIINKYTSFYNAHETFLRNILEFQDENMYKFTPESTKQFLEINFKYSIYRENFSKEYSKIEKEIEFILKKAVLRKDIDKFINTTNETLKITNDFNNDTVKTEKYNETIRNIKNEVSILKDLKFNAQFASNYDSLNNKVADFEDTKLSINSYLSTINKELLDFYKKTPKGK